MNDDKPELYVPRPGSIPWKVLTHLVAHPNDELLRKDAAAIAGCPGPSIDSVLGTAVSRGCLMKRRNNQLEVIWRLGDVKTFHLNPDPKPADDQQVRLLEEAATPWPPSAAAPAPVSVEVKTPEQPEPEAEPAPAKRPYTRKVRAGVNEQLAPPKDAKNETVAQPVGSREWWSNFRQEPLPAPPSDPEQRVAASAVSPVSPMAGMRILAMCPFKDTVIVATETGAFMYSAAAGQFEPIGFAAKAGATL